jgi:archaemetzincin
MTRKEEGFERLAPPRRGEWRSLFPEKEQTFDDYVARCANRRTPERGALLLQPLGTSADLGRMAEYGAAFFGLESRVLSPRPLPEAAHIFPRDQHKSSVILEGLTPPAEALVVLAVTDRDLFAPGKKFVFGEASLERRVGVISLARLESSDRRALKLMTHEAGHILSLAHCVTHRCVMQGSNTLEESDGHPLHLCPEDLRKVAWNTGVDPAARYRKLASLYSKFGWSEEAEWAEKRVVLAPRTEG